MDKPTFSNFLLNELMIDVDPNDPAGAQQALRRKAQIAKNSPDRAANQEVAAAKDEQRQARLSDSPTSQLESQIAKKKMELVMLQKRLIQIQRRSGATEGGM